MSDAPTPRVPLEIAEEIIHHLWPERDSEALKACSLTCHSLLFASQRQLFSSVSLSLPTPDSAPAATCTKFQLVLRRSPRIAHYVQILELQGLEPTTDSIDYLAGHHQAFIVCLSSLRNLRALKLRCHQGNFHASLWNDFFQRGFMRTMLDTVKLDQLADVDFDRVPMALAGLCPGVIHLSLRLPANADDVEIAVGQQVGSLNSISQPLSLRLDTFEPQHRLRKLDRHVDWLRELRKVGIGLQRLRSLSIRTDWTEWQESCGAWTTLRECAATLEDLSFEIQAPLVPLSPTCISFYSPKATGNSLTRDSLKNIRTLRVRVAAGVNEDEGGLGSCDLLPWVSGCLKALAPPGEQSNVEEVILQVNYTFSNETVCPYLLPWKDIISQLCNRTPFGRLRTVHLMVASESKVFIQSKAISRQITKFVQMHGRRKGVDISTHFSHKLYEGVQVQPPGY